MHRAVIHIEGCCRRAPEDKLDDLALRDEPLPAGVDADGAEEVVEVHNDMHAGIGQQAQVLQGLGGLQPQESHRGHHRMVKNVQQRQRLGLQAPA